MFLLKKCCSKNLIKKLAKKYCLKKPHPKILVLKSCHNNFVKKTSKNLVKKSYPKISRPLQLKS